MRSYLSTFVNFASFYAGWFACVLGAAGGRLWLGPVVVALLLVLHLGLLATRGISRLSNEARLIALIGLVGWCADTALAALGAYSFGSRSFLPWICPPWMVALWMIFASTLRGSLGWLRGRYSLAALLGALSGPVSYLYGARLGAIEMGEPLVASLATVASAWALILPGLVWLAHRDSTVVAAATPNPVAA